MSKQNFVFFTDVHFHKFSTLAKPDDVTGNSRFTEQLRVMQEVFDIARENDAMLLDGGDLFHKRGAVETDVFNKVYNLFNENSDRKVVHCIGNHDRQTNSLYSSSSLDLFKYNGGVVESSTPFTVEDNENNWAIYVLPYGDEIEELKDWLNKQDIDKTKTNILLGHLGLEGAKTGSGNHRLAGAFSYDDLRPDDFDYVLLGHYHKRQLLNEFNPKHIYGGSLLQNNFGETHDTGVYLLTVDTEDKKNNTTEFIPIKSTRFATVDANDLPSDLSDIMENDYVRFRGKTSDVKALENVTDDLSNVQIDLQEDYTKETRLDYEESSSPTEIVSKYIDTFLDGDEQIKAVSVSALNKVNTN